MISLCCAIILYKMRLDESTAFSAIHTQALKCKDANIHIFIYDNSPTSDITHIKYPYIHYQHNADNPGLGYAYNAAAQYAHQEHLEWLLLLDQDTNIPDDFLQKYLKAIHNNTNIKLFVPHVFQSNGQELSPLRRWKAQSKQLITNQTYPIKQYLLINSGLCIQLKLFENSGGYDEKIRVDFADTQFVRKLLHAGEQTFYLLNCKCLQNFSNDETELNKLKKRFQIYLENANNCKFIDFGDWLFRQYCIISHTFSLVKRTHNIYFLKQLIINMLRR